MDNVIFAVGSLIVLAGAVGVVATRSTVYAAMSLVGTLFGMAILFLTLQADFLAAVQVIVYAGAVVVLFLFVIMLVGIDRLENLRTEPLVGQRWLGLGAAIIVAAGLLFAVLKGTITGAESSTAKPEGRSQNVIDISKVLFTDYLFAFEITSLLLVIGVVGAVALARRRPRSDSELIDGDEPVVTFERDTDDDPDDVAENESGEAIGERR
jgi:NADH-quinone oxidoreductase subunit J